ncbi:hypothetical protein A1O1_07744 [Capronia coronata CBS 617.96]|uniref:Uncharacterized protein n=1 Tax=Capronia coronata CBS 617.96 TaxID=1182541 RepID=W9YHC3_9EURO|nr:uncharacterized protein A1O1_07744 [Capronia coronata CBS 617.96]EXJ81679.1 hypothetical protein A1O1_07744 [Capronia coronata CBS 617.96]
MFSLSPPTLPPQPSNFFVASRPRFHHQTLQTPSPLRTSRNANLNLMPKSSTAAADNESQYSHSSPLRSSSPFGPGPLGAEDQLSNAYNHENGNEKENAIAKETEKRDVNTATGAVWQKQKTKTPDAKVKESAASAVFMTPPESGKGSCFRSISNVQDSRFAQTGVSLPQLSPSTFRFEPQTAVSDRQTSNGWEHRSRDASPAAALARRAAQGRETKKTQFLDRIRRRRDDSRTEMYGDQVLRMDFVRERRQWEDEMNRRARMEVEAGIAWTGEEDDLDADMQDTQTATTKPRWPTADHEFGQDQGDPEAEMSPTEEYNVDDALVEYYADTMHDQGAEAESVPAGRGADDDYLIDDDDEEYDRLFREMIAQNQVRILTQSLRDQVQDQVQQQMEGGQHEQQSREQNESSMDWS